MIAEKVPAVVTFEFIPESVQNKEYSKIKEYIHIQDKEIEKEAIEKFREDYGRDKSIRLELGNIYGFVQLENRIWSSEPEYLIYPEEYDMSQ